MYVISWFDSDDAGNRRRVLELWLTAADGQRGTLYENEREQPGDTWPPATKLGTGYSRTSAAAMARRRGLSSMVQGEGVA